MDWDYDPRKVPIRQDVLDSLKLYNEKGLLPGGFLMAVLENDLAKACSRADMDNMRALVAIVVYVYNRMPQVCWGSRQKVMHWNMIGGMEGYQETALVKDE